MVKGRTTRDAMKAAKRCEEGKEEQEKEVRLFPVMVRSTTYQKEFCPPLKKPKIDPKAEPVGKAEGKADAGAEAELPLGRRGFRPKD
ncbi:hypothetical protein DY000_02016694 [Brassica cretica]|uniref:TPX2 C-terminal domain-containing protein n=1 Tax=Brassica cretica TaxID=69181 RepID=A0ABQ7CMB5_BRACR|nr:hypothetical protein DY000_02016694 [Brassica cretica]